MASGSKVGVEWVSISDLMSGVVGLMVVLFAVAALRVTEAERETKEAQDRVAQNKREAKERKEAGIVSAFSAIATDVRRLGLEDVIDVNVRDHRLRLRDATFESGSACVDQQARAALRVAAPRLREVLEANPEREVFIEGHSDSNVVVNSTSTVRTVCARFDDNYTLSTARAREALKVVVEEWDARLKTRVAVAGFGDSRQIKTAEPTSRVQRRVEISVREVEDAKTVSSEPR